MNAARRSISPAVVLAMAAIAAPAQADTVPTVTVMGTHIERVGNDAATVGLGVTAERTTAKAALAGTSRRIRAVIAAVKDAGGIDQADIRTGRISVRKITVRGDGGGPSGTRYRASQSVTVTVLAVKRTGDVVAAGVGAGATGVNGPRFFVSDSEARYRDALLRAFDSAKEKAQALAVRSGRALGQVLSITEGGGVVTIEQGSSAGQLADAGPGVKSPPVNPGKSQVRGRVTVVFELQ